MCLFFFFFNDTATTEIYTLSLHDALPIWVRPAAVEAEALAGTVAGGGRRDGQASVVAAEIVGAVAYGQRHTRSEEHTSELQSQSNLVCRLLLEKKKETNSHVQTSLDSV